jgi:hypothetical protein
MNVTDTGPNWVYLQTPNTAFRLWLEGPVNGLRDISDNEGEIYWSSGTIKYILNVQVRRLYVQYERQSNNVNGGAPYDAMNVEMPMTNRALVAVCQYLNRVTGATPQNYRVHYHVQRGHPVV